ncbi:zinc finger, CCHC-type containing protein [Tanacetum coccineum]
MTRTPDNDFKWLLLLVLGFNSDLGASLYFLDLLGNSILVCIVDLSVVYSGWSFVSAVLGQMTYLVASLTLDSARSYVMHGASFTQGMISSIPIGGSISPEGFLPSILLLVVIIVTVVIVVVILVVVIVAIVRVVIVVAIIGVVVVMGGVSSILKLSFMILVSVLGDPIGLVISQLAWAYAFHLRTRPSSVKVPVARFEKDGGTRIQACFQDELDNVVEEEDGGWICFLGGNNSSGIKKYQGSNSSDGGNTEDGVKIAGGVIGSGGGIVLGFNSDLGASLHFLDLPMNSILVCIVDLRPKDIIPNLEKSQRDDHSDDVSSETPKFRRGKRARKAKSYGSDFQLYFVEGSRDQVGSQYSYCYSIEKDPRTYNEAMQSRDDAFWKEGVDDEIVSIMENNTWVLSDLPPGCKPLGCKWIFKRKMKVDGTIEKFKARLVIQGFRQKEGIDYIETYAPVARIITIRLLLALAAIHNLVIHQMDVKTTFLNGDLDEEVYMKQLEGFVMSGNKHKVDKTKKFLSSKFSMKDMGEADVILGIKIKRENKGIVITQSHYIEKILKKFNRGDCSPVSTPMDPVKKLKPDTDKPVDQLEYSRAIGCFMYAMTRTRPDIAYAVGRLSRFTSNPSRQHWQAITRVFKYLTGTMNYGLSYIGYPSVLEAYSDASWINHVEDSSSTSGWVFLLRGGAISWASKNKHASVVLLWNLTL